MMSGKTHKAGLLVALAALLFLSSGALSEASAAVIKGEAIKAYVRTYIKKNMPWPKDTAVRIEFPGTVSNLSMPGEITSCRVSSKRNEDFIGNSTFTVRYYKNDTFLNGKTVRVKIEVLMDVVVSTRSLQRNIQIGRDDVKLVRKWFGRLPSNSISNPETVVGMKLRTSVKPNAEITGKMVKSVPMVKRGKPVRIIFENGPMRITAVGLSEQDGMFGELIRVRNVSSKKVIYVRVTGDSLTKVEL